MKIVLLLLILSLAKCVKIESLKLRPIEEPPRSNFNQSRIVTFVNDILRGTTLLQDNMAPGNESIQASAKSQCLSLFNNKLNNFNTAFEKFFNECHKNLSFSLNSFLATIWAKFGEITVEVGGSTKQCSKILNMKPNLNPDEQARADTIIQNSLYPEEARFQRTENRSKFITGVLSIKRNSKDFDSSTFTKLMRNSNNPPALY